MDSFRFLFNEDEFKRQNPILVSLQNNSWIKGIELIGFYIFRRKILEEGIFRLRKKGGG